MAEAASEIQETDPEQRPLDPVLGRLAQAAAVDARNLLQVLQAYLERLEERFEDDAFRDELQTFIDEAAGRVESTLDQIEGALGSSDQG
jgi:hypothetical protein